MEAIICVGLPGSEKSSFYRKIELFKTGADLCVLPDMQADYEASSEELRAATVSADAVLAATTHALVRPQVGGTS